MTARRYPLAGTISSPTLCLNASRSDRFVIESSVLSQTFLNPPFYHNRLPVVSSMYLNSIATSGGKNRLDINSLGGYTRHISFEDEFPGQCTCLARIHGKTHETSTSTDVKLSRDQKIRVSLRESEENFSMA
jgi:hypothetical protein